MGEDVIVIKVSGGLGNQMQQYALYRKFKEMGREAYLDLTWFSPENQEETGTFLLPAGAFRRGTEGSPAFFFSKKGK